jgi:hypothetical protein
MTTAAFHAVGVRRRASPHDLTGVTVAVGHVECTGPLDGYQPIGPITTRHFFTYGDRSPNDCTRLEASGWVDYFVPTVTGVVVLRNHFTGGIKASDPADAMVIHGDRLTGRAFVQSVEGDCITTPLTKMEVGWIGQWHDQRRANETALRQVHEPVRRSSEPSGPPR